METLFRTWSSQATEHIDTTGIFENSWRRVSVAESNNKRQCIESMTCRARTWTGRCKHQKCQTGSYPHLCLSCSKKAYETSVPNSFESNTSMEGKPPKRIGLKFGTIDTPITELIFAPDGQIATVWPNDEVREIVKKAQQRGIGFHPGSKEARLQKNKITKIKVKKVTPTCQEKLPCSLKTKNVTTTTKKIKIMIKKNSDKISSCSPTSTQGVRKTSMKKKLTPATFRKDGTVDFGWLPDTDDEAEDEENYQIQKGEDPCIFIKQEIQEAGGIAKVKVNILKQWLKLIGLPHTGNKIKLQTRINQWISNDSDSESD